MIGQKYYVLFSPKRRGDKKMSKLKNEEVGSLYGFFYPVVFAMIILIYYILLIELIKVN